MNEPEINGILRAMAWQRAKAELYAMLETYQNNMTKFTALDNLTLAKDGLGAQDSTLVLLALYVQCCII